MGLEWRVQCDTCSEITKFSTDERAEAISYAFDYGWSLFQLKGSGQTTMCPKCVATRNYPPGLLPAQDDAHALAKLQLGVKALHGELKAQQGDFQNYGFRKATSGFLDALECLLRENGIQPKAPTECSGEGQTGQVLELPLQVKPPPGGIHVANGAPMHGPGDRQT